MDFMIYKIIFIILILNIVESTLIKVCILDFAPFAYVNYDLSARDGIVFSEEEIKGVMFEMFLKTVNKIDDGNSYTYQYQVDTASLCVNKLKLGEVDMVFPLFPTNYRQTFAVFSTITQLTFAGVYGFDNYDSPFDFKGKTIGLTLNASFTEFFETLMDSMQIEVEKRYFHYTANGLLEQLVAKSIDVAICDIYNAQYIIDLIYSSVDVEIVEGQFYLSPEFNTFAFGNNSANGIAFYNVFNPKLTELIENGTIILSQLKFPVQSPQRVKTTTITITLGIIAFFLMVLILSFIILRRSHFIYGETYKKVNRSLSLLLSSSLNAIIIVNSDFRLLFSNLAANYLLNINVQNHSLLRFPDFLPTDSKNKSILNQRLKEIATSKDCNFANIRMDMEVRFMRNSTDNSNNGNLNVNSDSNIFDIEQSIPAYFLEALPCLNSLSNVKKHYFSVDILPVEKFDTATDLFYTNRSAIKVNSNLNTNNSLANTANTLNNAESFSKNTSKTHNNGSKLSRSQSQHIDNEINSKTNSIFDRFDFRNRKKAITHYGYIIKFDDLCLEVNTIQTLEKQHDEKSLGRMKLLAGYQIRNTFNLVQCSIDSTLINVSKLFSEEISPFATGDKRFDPLSYNWKDIKELLKEIQRDENLAGLLEKEDDIYDLLSSLWNNMTLINQAQEHLLDAKMSYDYLFNDTVLEHDDTLQLGSFLDLLTKLVAVEFPLSIIRVQNHSDVRLSLSHLKKPQLRIVLFNVLINAVEACVNTTDSPNSEDVGHVVISAKENIQGANRIIEIAIYDKGKGIPLDNLSKVFNHGFTTKKGHFGPVVKQLYLFTKKVNSENSF
eukprot:TRINITY_DN3171_c3_g3_i1.p1 TRINITY_DN3171_c3_g3~~TRINITY_DN3171_c3_g3_i1.p1  ORF type:complete len:833 (+),score=156.54 TRINITY_DN3171_c3_g3_i1:63-2561(+)